MDRKDELIDLGAASVETKGPLTQEPVEEHDFRISVEQISKD